MFLTLMETAAIAAVKPKAIRHALAAKVLKPAGKAAGGRRFSADDAVFLALREALPLSREDQAAIYGA
jgi:hypothetical protein